MPKTANTTPLQEYTAGNLAQVPTATPPMGQSLMGNSKSEMLNTVIGHISKFDKGQMVDFFDKVMAQFGPNKAPGEVDNAAKNKATLHPKSGIKEDLQEIFKTDESLSEDFKEKATTLFESAIELAITTETVRLTEEFDAKLLEQVSTLRTELAEKVDGYTTFAIKKWHEDNKLELEEGFKQELTMKFIDNLKKVFSESYIEMPEDKMDVLKEAETKVTELETKLNQAITESIEQNKIVNKFKLLEAKKELVSGLSTMQVEKFDKLTLILEDENLDAYVTKATLIKDTYFPKSVTEQTQEIPGVLTEEETTPNQNVKSNDPTIDAYVGFISKTSKV